MDWRERPSFFVRPLLRPRSIRQIRRLNLAWSRPIKTLSWGRTHKRNVHVSPVAWRRLSEPVLNPALDLMSLEESYFAAGRRIGTSAAGCKQESTEKHVGGWVVVDDLLSPPTLLALRRYLTESTFYYHPKFAGDVLSATLEDGMAHPILEQIAESLREAFPRILGPHFLQSAWASKLDSSQKDPVTDAPGRRKGAGLRVDPASVNLNFWPIQGGRSAKGGLVLYDSGPPETVSEEKLRIPELLKEHIGGSKYEEFDYKANRLVMFNSDLMHDTGLVNFPRGYKRRRINFTFLFGKRCSM